MLTVLKSCQRSANPVITTYVAFEDQKISFGNQERRDSFVVEFPYAFVYDFGELMAKKAKVLTTHISRLKKMDLK